MKLIYLITWKGFIADMSTRTLYKKGEDSHKEEYNNMAYVFCRDSGATDIKLGNLFGVCKVTIWHWKNNHPEFKAAVVRGKDEFNSSTAETNLMKRVKGYSYLEVTKKPVDRLVPDKNGVDQVVTSLEVVKTTKKFIPPSVKAIKYFLRNRDKIRWPDKIDIEFNDLTVLLKKKRFDGESIDDD